MNITLIGAGNVATWIAQRLQDSPVFRITAVYSRTLENARKVASLSSAYATDNISELNNESDIFIFSLSDSAYDGFLNRLDFKMKAAFMTSGTFSCKCLGKKSDYFGVIYPLQTLTKTQDMREIEVPLCIESSYAGPMYETLWNLGRELSPFCHEVSEEQRTILHLAAVFACNFSNAMYCIADKILSDNNLSISILQPLLKNTVDKLKYMSPKEAQTGPAARNDKNIIDRHLELLSDNEIRNIYSAITEYIINQN